MTCGLAKDALDLLFYLYSNRCLSDRHSRSEKAIERDLSAKMDVQQVLQTLLNAGLIGRKKKQQYNYWADAGNVMNILREHSYPLSFGGRRPIEKKRME